MRTKRYISLEADEIITLEEGRKNATHHQFRNRCHALLLSHQKYDMIRISEIFGVTYGTVTNWFNGWQKAGLVGLQNQPGQGRKTILTLGDLPKIKEKIQANPQQMKLVRDDLKNELAKDFSEKTLKRFLKKLVMSFGDVAESR